MLIIIEGPDQVGKTTLAGRLAATLQTSSGHERDVVEVLHCGPPMKHPLDEYERPLWDYRSGTGEHVICDRWHLGERVYPAVLGRPTEMDNASWYHIELFLRSRGALLVPMFGDPDVLSFRIEPMQHWPDDAAFENWQVRHRWEVKRLFDEYVRVSLLPHFPIPGTGVHGTQPPALEPIIAAARLAEDLAKATSGYETYIGSGTPRALLLGERRGNSKGPQEGPAFGPYPGTSGRWLLNALATRPDLVREVGLANACEEPDLFELWKQLGSPPVVTLGREAARCVTALPNGRRPFPVAEVPHPQYVRRFQHRRKTEYADLVADAVGRRGRQDWDL